MDIEEQAESTEGGEQPDLSDADLTPASQGSVLADASAMQQNVSAELHLAESQEQHDFVTAAERVAQTAASEPTNEQGDSVVSSIAAVEPEVNPNTMQEGVLQPNQQRDVRSLPNSPPMEEFLRRPTTEATEERDSAISSTAAVRPEVNPDTIQEGFVSQLNSPHMVHLLGRSTTAAPETTNEQRDSLVSSTAAIGQDEVVLQPNQEVPNERRGFRMLRDSPPAELMRRPITTPHPNNEGDAVVSSSAAVPVEQRGFQLFRNSPPRPEFIRFRPPAPTAMQDDAPVANVAQPEANDIELPDANGSNSPFLVDIPDIIIPAAEWNDRFEVPGPFGNQPNAAEGNNVFPLGMLGFHFSHSWEGPENATRPPLNAAGLPELVEIQREGVNRIAGSENDVPVNPGPGQVNEERRHDLVASLWRIQRATEQREEPAEGADGQDRDARDLPEPEFSDTDSTDDELALNRWRMPSSDVSVQAAIRELIERGRRTEGGVPALMTRENFMQRMRRIMFSYNHRRRRHSRAGGDGYFDEDARSEPDDLDPTREEPVAQPVPENAVRFDTNLPAEHSYLGNMNRVSGVNYLDVGQTHHLMLFQHAHILFPGDVLPFMICGSLGEADIDAQTGLLFGVCFPSMRANEEEDIMYGVTCQIYERGVDGRTNTMIKSRVLQRFTTKFSELNGILPYIASAPTQSKCHGMVKILPEIYLPEPLNCINMGSMNRFRDNASMLQTFRRYQAATTPFQTHSFEYYNMSVVVEKARTLLAQHKIDTMPTDPITLSFWLVRNLHLTELMMKRIFMTDCVNTRMKLIQSTFKADSLFVCRYCGNRIANCRELFAMSKHGVQTQYCNSAGYIHETNTVYSLVRNAVIYSGHPSTKFSWFPGYQWHIIVCRLCTRHIGWEFKAVEANLVPTKFFGISGTSVRITSPSSVEQDPAAAMFENILSYAQTNMQ